MELQARAKLNLTLDVLGCREDGYHDLRMVMQSIDLTDTLVVRPGTGEGIQVGTNLNFLPNGDKNLAAIAARQFWKAMGKEPVPLDIEIQKRIPVCAGMAGGRSDAAAVLRGLNEQEGCPFSMEELAHVGESVGSDVPYCVLGGTALAEGRGEILTVLPALPKCHVVVCKPDFPISTPELFHRIDSVKVRRRPDTAGVLAADLGGVARRMYNVFEDVLNERQAAQVTQIKRTLIEYGALGATMSGTGPTAFGLFSDRKQAEQAYESLAQDYRETYLTQTV